MCLCFLLPIIPTIPLIQLVVFFGPLPLFPKRLLNDTVIEPERMLGGDVAKALRQQWSMEAVATPARKDRPSILRDAFERVGEASKEPGGLKRFFDDHIPRLMLSFQVGVNLNDLILVFTVFTIWIINAREKDENTPVLRWTNARDRNTVTNLAQCL